MGGFQVRVKPDYLLIGLFWVRFEFEFGLSQMYHFDNVISPTAWLTVQYDFPIG